jgi:hypothetical protein
MNVNNLFYIDEWFFYEDDNSLFILFEKIDDKWKNILFAYIEQK